MSQITRPVMRYHGAKYRIAHWVISHFPDHDTYVEPFGGSAGVLLQKQRSTAEVYNDLDHDVVRLFEVLRDPARAAELTRRLTLTPFAREELERCYAWNACPIENSRRLVTRSFLGFGADAATRGHRTGFRCYRSSGMQSPATEFMRYPHALAAIVERLRGITIENKDWREIVTQFDGSETLFYMDPPYVHSTRGRPRGYRHELSEEDHLELINSSRDCQAMVVLSGYDTDLYNDTLSGWQKHSFSARAERNKPTVECIWVKPNTAAQPDLFKSAPKELRA